MICYEIRFYVPLLDDPLSDTDQVAFLECLWVCVTIYGCAPSGDRAALPVWRASSPAIYSTEINL